MPRIKKDTSSERVLVQKLDETPLQNAVYNFVEKMGNIEGEDWIRHISIGEEAQFKTEFDPDMKIMTLKLVFLYKRQKEKI